jgi:hypothetical protein
MDERRSMQAMKSTKKRALGLAGLPAGIVLVFAIALALAASAGAGTARIAVAPSNTSPPTITGTAQQGQTVTVNKGAWSGTEPITYSYQWQRGDSNGGHWTSIKSATTTTYTIQKQDVGNTLQVTVTGRNADGANSATSVATAVVKAVATAAPANTSPPTITGATQQGQTLTADRGAWSGTEPITYSYRWQRGDSSGGHWTSIGGATHASYTLQKADVDMMLHVVVTAKNAAGSNSATSVPTAVVKASAVPTVTLKLSTLRVVYRNPVILTGTISTRQAGESVAIFAQRFSFADTNFARLATVTTSSDGTWSYSTKPTIKTTYQAHWKGVTSPMLAVGVKPLVAFHVITGNRFSTKVVAARSFVTRIVQFQRRSSYGQWVTLKRLRLNASSAAIFRAKLPTGTSRLRIAISVNQSGAGYLGGISRTIVYHRG